MIVGIVSAKGSPGVTTTCLALTAAASHDALLVEFDPSGGSIECWTGVTGEPGLIPAASALRRSTGIDTVLNDAVEVVSGVRAVLAPSSGQLAEAAVGAATDRLLPALAAFDMTVVVDGGRWAASQKTSSRLAGCDVVIVLCAPSVAGVEAARWLVDPLRSVSRAAVALAPVGDRPYGPSEIAALVDVPLVGPLAWDSRGVNLLVGRGAIGAWRRTALARSVASVLRFASTRPPERVASGND